MSDRFLKLSEISGFSDGGRIWNRKGTVLSPSLDTDQNSLLEPTVIYEGNPQIIPDATAVFKMWFHAGWDVPNISYAESVDGVTWVRKATPVILNYNRSFVLKNGPTYYCYATNFNQTAIDQFTSNDGITWTLAHSGVITASGTVQNVFSPYIFIEGGIWKMLLDISTGGEYAEALYTSTDGITWTAYSGNPVMTISGGNPYIIKVDGVYYNYGHGNLSRQPLPTDIFRESSTDLVNWTTPVPVLKRRTYDEGANMNIGQVSDLAIIEVNNQVYLFYSASRDGNVANGEFHIKLAIANMPLSQLVTINTDHDTADIENNTGSFNLGYDPQTGLTTVKGGDYTTIAIDAPQYPALVFKKNGLANFDINVGINTDGSPNLNIAATVSPATITLIGNDPTGQYGAGIIIEGGLFVVGNNALKMGTADSFIAQSFGSGSSSGFEWDFIFGGHSKKLAIGTTGQINYDGAQDALDVLFSCYKNITFGAYAVGGGLQDQSKVFVIFDVANRSVIINGGGAYATDPSAQLQVDSTSKGFRPPKMTTAQKNAISSPSESLMVYDTTLHKLCVYNGSAWETISSS